MHMQATPSAPILLYRSKVSGHSHRVELFLSLLGLPFEMMDVDLRGGANRSDAYLALNPFGQVPVIDDNGTVVYDSNAILVYLARTYGGERWMPSDVASQVALQQWFSIAAGPVLNGPGAARMVSLFRAPLDHERAKGIAHKLFAVLEQGFSKAAYAIGDEASLADIAAYSYIAHAPEGGVDLAPYPALCAWLARIEALPGFVPMQRAAPAT
ncbi:glutathione S-transferase family protein [Telluria aromaticivorans]|uniref:Glutathione S-transferase family protein n=1 Tax=Telluria aromaticivorans TaxID=2725995 RepID=A0A7Y2JWC6_9BURK|nr:glutathione S-transferase family protein [Telluria aromaticivorans]